MDLKFGICLAAIAAIAGYCYFYQRQRTAVARRHGCERPMAMATKEPFFALDYQFAIHGDCDALVDFHAQYGSTFDVRPIIGARNIVTIAPDNLNIIWGGSKDWGIQPLRLSAMEGFVGHGFVTCDGEIWSRSRRMLKPTFVKNNINDLSTLATATDRFLSELPTDGSTVDLQPKLFEIFFHTSIKFLLGVDILKGDSKSPHPPRTFIKAFHDALFGIGYRIIVGELRGYIPNNGFRAACRQCHEFINFYIDKGIADMKEIQISNLQGLTPREAGKQRKTLLEGLTEQTSDKVFIRSQILQAMIAAQETTSILLANTIFLLSRHPVYWQRIQAEVKDKGDSLLNFDALNTCTTIRHILLESLRFYPIFPIMVRVALTDTILPSGGGPNCKAPIYVRKGDCALTSFYAAHRTRHVFGDELNDFNPDRWKYCDPGQWDYMPFGSGPRNCLGQHKALVEASYVLARLAINFGVLESRDERDWSPAIKLSCQNTNGCKVGLL